MTKKKRQRGFSLIELIIAIAILVVLTGLLAPQFMKYIEKARQAKMMQKLDNISEALQVAFIEATENGTVQTSGGILIYRGTVADKKNQLDKAVCDIMAVSLGRDEMKSITIMTDDSMGGSGSSFEDKYSFEDILIFYYPTKGNYPQYYYRKNMKEMDGAYPGTYGERTQDKAIIWKD